MRRPRCLASGNKKTRVLVYTIMPRPTGDATANRFRVLLRHFFRQFFDKEALAPQAENETALAQLLGFLAVPTAFFTLVFRPFGLLGWNHVSLRYLFICYSMTAIAFVVVLKWDTLLPDRRDYLILTPLPIRMCTLFLAKAAALGLFAAVFLLAVNGLGVLFWPGIDGRPDFLHSLSVHAFVLLASGVFAAFSAAAVYGVLITLFTGALLRIVTAVLQTLLLGALVTVLVLTPLMGFSMHHLVRIDSPLLHYFPVCWFIGLYEQIRPATGDPVLLNVGTTALPATGIALALFVLTYLPGYRRHARRVLDVPRADPSGPGPLRTCITRILHSTILKYPVERAVFHFISHSLARSMKHRIFLAGYGGLGAALAVFSLASGRSGLIELPLTLSFILVSGLRAAFNFPSELRANWMLQIAETSHVVHYVAATRKWILTSAVAPLFALLAPVQFAQHSWPVAAYHVVFGFLMSALLIEVMFFGFRKVPFTCAYFPGKVNLIGLGVLYVFGFTTYSSLMSSVEESLLTFPWIAVLFLSALAGLRQALSNAADRYMSRQGALDYSASDPAVCTLNVGPAAGLEADCQSVNNHA